MAEENQVEITRGQGDTAKQNEYKIIRHKRHVITLRIPENIQRKLVILANKKQIDYSLNQFIVNIIRSHLENVEIEDLEAQVRGRRGA